MSLLEPTGAAEKNSFYSFYLMYLKQYPPTSKSRGGSTPIVTYNQILFKKEYDLFVLIEMILETNKMILQNSHANNKICRFSTGWKPN